MCIQTGKTMTDPNRMHWDHARFLPEVARRDDGAVRRAGRRRRPHLGDRAALPGEAGKGQGAVPALRRSRRTTRPIPTSSTWRARDSRSAARASKPCAPQGQLKHDLPEYVERLDREIEMIQQMKFSGYFLIVWDFIRYAKSQGIPGGSGPRFGGRQPGRLRDGDHRYRSAAVRAAVRALPQSRAHQHARYRHRFLHEPPRRSDPVRHREVRPRAGGADHHVQYAGRARRDQGCRPRARHELRRRRARSPSWCRTSSTSS